MIECNRKAGKISLLFLLSLIFFFHSSSAQDGKTIFNAQCARCHALDVKLTGPALRNVEARWPSRALLKQWIHKNSALIASGDPKAVEVSKIDGSLMPDFEYLKDEEIEAIIDYTNTPPEVKPTDTGSSTSGSGGNQNAIFFGIVSLIMAIIALILMQVNSNLKKLSDDAEGVRRPEPLPFYRNKTYIALLAIVFFVIGGYYVTKGAIGLGRQKDYQPVQPIYYSHKVHAGINQISCLYCHGNAMDSKHAAIPSTNVCMNCHKTVQEYKGPQLYDANGEEINGTAEIAKLYKYAGFDKNNANAWDPSKAQPIPWVKIHNLPDHVYFSHEQHVAVGNVQCQSCHGEITAMDEVYQFSELSMGWCINCHRDTKVDFYNDTTGKGNKFYSIYEKFHNDVKSGRMDSVTVKDIGGLECQKCHY